MTWWLIGCEDSRRRRSLFNIVSQVTNTVPGTWWALRKHLFNEQMNDDSMLSDLDQWEAFKGNTKGGTGFAVVKREIMVHMKCLWLIRWHLDTVVGNWINLGSRERFGCYLIGTWVGKEA